jgi:hypothetical protein
MGAFPPPVPAVMPTEKNWFARNWKWFVPTIVVTVVLLIVAFVVGVAAIVFGAIRNNEPYQHAIEVVTHDQRALNALGAPVQPRWLVSGSINVSGPSGDANLAIPVRGQARAGTVYLVAKKSAGKWTYETLELEVEGQPARISFLNSHGGESGKY